MVLSGELRAVGSDVRRFAVGDQVFGFDRRAFGAYAQFACWLADGLLALRPPAVSDEQAAAVAYGGLLAAHLARRGRVRSGHRVLVYGASGAVGTAAVQLCRELGAEVTGVCGPANADLVRALGAGAVIDYTAQDVASGDVSYDVVLDAVGRNKSAGVLRDIRRALAPRGVCVSIDDGTPKLRREDLTSLGEAVADGRFVAVVDRTFALDDIVAAHTYVDAGHKRGNVVVTVP